VRQSRFWLAQGVVGFLLLATLVVTCGERVAPVRQFKTYPLAGSIRSADISPDDRFVAVSVVERSSSKTDVVVDTSKVEIRDFRTDKTVASLTLADSGPLPTKRIVDGVPSAIVRYTWDGHSLLVWFRSELYVLQSTDLKLTQKVGLPVPFPTGDKKKQPYLPQLEIAPNGRWVEVLWKVGRENAFSSYEIPSGGQNGGTWPFPEDDIAGFSLSEDGSSAIFSMGRAFCSSQANTTGVMALDLRSGSSELLVSTDSMPSSPAILPGNEVAITANRGCRNPDDKPDPELLVYSRKNNALVYRGRTQDATGWILATPKSNRMVAYSGDWKRHFDWGDFTGWYYSPGRESFTVWESPTLQPIARSQNIPKLASCGVRISRSGRYIVTSGWRRDARYALYELP
jgi:hypothetical protein